jgi:hypothetical protein
MILHAHGRFAWQADMSHSKNSHSACRCDQHLKSHNMHLQMKLPMKPAACQMDSQFEPNERNRIAVL